MENFKIDKDCSKLVDLYLDTYGWDDSDCSLDYENDDYNSEIKKRCANKIDNFIKRINDSKDETLIRRISNYSDEFLLDLIFTCSDSEDRTNKASYQWVQEIINYTENEYSEMNEYTPKNDYTKYYEAMNYFLEENIDNTNSESTYIFEKSKELSLLLEEFGHPFFLKQEINTDRRFFDCEFVKLTMYYNNFLNDNLDLCFHPRKLHYILLSHCCDEIIKYLNTFFDALFIHWHNINLLNSIIKDIRREINQINDLINGFTINEYIDNEDDKSYNNLLNFEFVQYRKNRDNIFKKLNKLKNTSTPLTEFNILTYLNNNSLDQNNFFKCLVEKENYNETTIKNNFDLILNFSETIKLNDILNRNKNIPHVYYKLDVSDYLTAKILYHEFITTGNEFKLKSEKHGHKDNLIIMKVLKNIIATVQNKPISGYTLNYSNDDKFDNRINEKNTVRYYQSILLSEKIRRGFYREFNMVEAFNLIYDLQLELRNLLTDIFMCNNINHNSFAINTFYKRLVSLLEELSDTVQNH